MQNSTFSYNLPSPQQGSDFTIAVRAVSTNVQVVSNQATMYALFQGPVPLPYNQHFRWIAIPGTWEDTGTAELVNMIAVCVFNFGAYSLCTVNNVS